MQCAKAPHEPDFKTLSCPDSWSLLFCGKGLPEPFKAPKAGALGVVEASTIAAVGLQLATAAVAAYGAWRCIRLMRFGSDSRLKALAWFFGLFAASIALHAVWEYQIGNLLEVNRPVPGTPRPGGNETNQSSFDRPFVGFFRPEGIERVTPWLFGHHVLMLASLSVAVTAYARRRPEHATAVVAFSPLLLLGDLTVLLLGMEAALTLYLATRAMINHVERRSPGALKVAIGFALFFLGHLMFFLAHRPGEGRQGIGDVLALVGIILLVEVLPGKQ